MSSSTSSSKRHLPWGALWGIGLFLVVELVFRLLPTTFCLTFDQNDYERTDTLDFAAVSLAIELLPPPEVAVFGTSRGREGVQSPVLAEALAARLGRPVEVRNYSAAAGRIDTSLALFERLTQEGKLPRVVLLVLDASDLRDETPDETRWRYVTFASLPGEVARNGRPSETDFSYVLGNSMPLRLAQARAAVGYRLLDRGAGDWGMAELGNPAFGGASAWARGLDEQMKTLSRPPPMRWTQERVKRTVAGYVLHDRALARLRDLAAHARASGTRLVLAELPIAPIVLADPRVVAARAELEQALVALEDRECVRVWTASGAQDQFWSRLFRDPSHLNSVGARTFVGLVAPTVADALAASGGSCVP